MLPSMANMIGPQFFEIKLQTKGYSLEFGPPRTKSLINHLQD